MAPPSSRWPSERSDPRAGPATVATFSLVERAERVETTAHGSGFDKTSCLGLLNQRVTRGPSRITRVILALPSDRGGAILVLAQRAERLPRWSASGATSSLAERPRCPSRWLSERSESKPPRAVLVRQGLVPRPAQPASDPRPLPNHASAPHADRVTVAAPSSRWPSDRGDVLVGPASGETSSLAQRPRCPPRWLSERRDFLVGPAPVATFSLVERAERLPRWPSDRGALLVG